MTDRRDATTDSILAPRVVETHTAILFFVGDRVYKLKKTVDLGFLDHREREARQHACAQEVALNSRLAPDAYDGVLDISGPDGQLIDHLVSMRRMPDEQRLTRCIQRGEDLDDTLRTIARSVARLHGGSEPEAGHDGNATMHAVLRRWSDGFEQLRPHTVQVPRSERLERIEELVRRYLAGRRALFDTRIAQGRIRDGHGDLQAEDIFVTAEGPQILDCIEFGDDYRWGDILSDVAFLAMDLERLGRADLAERFLSWHGEFTGDTWPRSLAHHYVAYRAHIRAKVGILAHAQRGESVGAGVCELIDLALAHLEDGQVRLVLIGGLPGTGKSTVASGVADRLGAVLLRTDEIRRNLHTDSGSGRYSDTAVAATYAALLDEATRLLGAGESVVLDATWSDPDRRSEARAVAEATFSVCTEVECTLPRAIADERIAARRAVGTDPSEATEAVAAAMAARFAPWPEAVPLATIDAPDVVADAALASIRCR